MCKIFESCCTEDWSLTFGTEAAIPKPKRHYQLQKSLVNSGHSAWIDFIGDSSIEFCDIRPEKFSSIPPKLQLDWANHKIKIPLYEFSGSLGSKDWPEYGPLYTAVGTEEDYLWFANKNGAVLKGGYTKKEYLGYIQVNFDIALKEKATTQKLEDDIKLLTLFIQRLLQTRFKCVLKMKFKYYNNLDPVIKNILNKEEQNENISTVGEDVFLEYYSCDGLEVYSYFNMLKPLLSDKAAVSKLFLQDLANLLEKYNAHGAITPKNGVMEVTSLDYGILAYLEGTFSSEELLRNISHKGV